jgi:hypothetical protein
MKLKSIFQKSAGANYVRRYLVQTDAERAHAELQRDIALAGIHDGHPLWQAVLLLVDEAAQRSTEAALVSNLTNEQRQFSAGCAAQSEYIGEMLRDAQTLAIQRIAKQKRE